MKSKIVSTLLVFLTCLSLTACSTKEEHLSKSGLDPVMTQQEFLTREDVQKMIDDSNSDLKKEILSETMKTINTQLGESKLSQTDKDELKASILSSIEGTFNKSGTTVVQQEPDQYITNVTEQYITDASGSNDPPQIEDGTPIPISFELPYTFTYTLSDQSVFTFVINQAEFYAYNHQNEPYREISYPYEIRYTISGTLTRDNEDIQAMFYEPPFTLIFEPFGSPMQLGQMHVDYENNTFSCESVLTVNMIPDRIVMQE